MWARRAMRLRHGHAVVLVVVVLLEVPQKTWGYGAFNAPARWWKTLARICRSLTWLEQTYLAPAANISTCGSNNSERDVCHFQHSNLFKLFATIWFNLALTTCNMPAATTKTRATKKVTEHITCLWLISHVPCTDLLSPSLPPCLPLSALFSLLPRSNVVKPHQKHSTSICRIHD